LNVGVSPAASVGTDVNPYAVFWNTSTASNYADGGTGGVGKFRQDINTDSVYGWGGYVPAVQLTSTTPPPKSKDQCKSGGWQQCPNLAFKNQGDCIQFVNTGK
jgi:hypothetical protein